MVYEDSGYPFSAVVHFHRFSHTEFKMVAMVCEIIYFDKGSVRKYGTDDTEICQREPNAIPAIPSFTLSILVD
jgi:hypothetical protein